MIHEVINYLVNTPSATASPVYQAVNTPAMLTTQGGVLTSIPVFDTRPLSQSQLVPPYVRFAYIGEFTLLQPAINNGIQYQTTIQAASLECAANGATPYQAAFRAEKFRLAATAAIANAKSYVMSGALTMTDDGGTGSILKVSNFLLRPMPEPPGPSGPGASASGAIFTKITRMRLEVWVEYSLTH